MQKTALIGLGSNLGNRMEYLKRSLDLLANGDTVSVDAVSSVYETQPVGGPEQSLYLNACARVRTSLQPTLLLLKMLTVENNMGRVRREQWGARIIDLDLLFYDDVTMRTPLLELPHPRLADRFFVLVPLADIVPDLIVPGKGTTVRKMISENPSSTGIKLFRDPGWYQTKANGTEHP